MDNTELPKFNEGMAKGNTCAKCAVVFDIFVGANLGVSYCRGGNICRLENPVFGEHLHRTCGNCHYIWAEQTADKK